LHVGALGFIINEANGTGKWSRDGGGSGGRCGGRGGGDAANVLTYRDLVAMQLKLERECRLEDSSSERGKPQAQA